MVVGFIVFAYAYYIALFPLVKTIRGGFQVLKKHGKQRLKTIKREYDSIPDTQLGLTMADGVDHIEEEKAFVDERTP